MHNTILVLRTAILFISCNIEGSRLMICKLRKITFIFYCNTINLKIMKETVLSLD